jgi:Zn-dependent metalloprotease
MKDYGGVHTNSGIANQAFYLAATAIGGHAWEKAGLIWYDALCDERLPSASGFLAFGRFTVAAAGKLFGGTSSVRDAVRNAWNTVGVAV